MAMVQAYLPPLQKAGKTLLWAVAGFGVVTSIFGLSRSFWLSLLMLALSGAFDNISVVVRRTLLAGANTRLFARPLSLMSAVSSSAPRTSWVALNLGWRRHCLVQLRWCWLVALLSPAIRQLGSLHEVHINL